MLDGTNVNHTLVKDDRYRWYRKYVAAHHSLVRFPTPPPNPYNVLPDPLYLLQRDPNGRG